MRLPWKLLCCEIRKCGAIIRAEGGSPAVDDAGVAGAANEFISQLLADEDSHARLREDNSDDLLAIVLHSPVALPAVALALMVNGIGTPGGCHLL